MKTGAHPPPLPDLRIGLPFEDDLIGTTWTGSDGPSLRERPAARPPVI